MVYACIEDLRRVAARRLPKMLFDYMESGSFSERTLAANRSDFDRWLLEQRVLVDVSRRDLSVDILGKRAALPLILGPVGFSGLFACRGEILAARAARDAGVPFCLSSYGISSVEEIRAATDGPLWFQLYVLKDRALAESFISRAERAGVDALCFTVDSTVLSVRESDVRNGFRYMARPTARLAMMMLARPRWCWSMMRAGRPRIALLSDRPELGRGLLEQVAGLGSQIDPRMSWDDLERVRERWKGKLVLKGILSVADARRAAEAGVDAIVVSNHGGRQLDCARSTISVLPDIVAAVGDRVEVLMDGGVRRGTDIVKAMALGARAVLVGRAYVYGLAAAGELGVREAIRLLATEVESTIGHMGMTNVRELHVRRDELLHDRYRMHGEGAYDCAASSLSAVERAERTAGIAERV